MIDLFAREAKVTEQNFDIIIAIINVIFNGYTYLRTFVRPLNRQFKRCSVKSCSRIEKRHVWNRETVSRVRFL